MKRVRATSTTTVLIAAALVSALSGCSFSVDLPSTEPSTPTSTTPPAEDETPTPDTEPVALTIPGCDALLTVDQARSIMDAPNAEFLAEYPPAEYSLWYDLPTVASAISDLTVGRWCWWGVPNSDYSFYLLVAEVDRDSRATVEEALATDGFSMSIMGARTVYDKGIVGDYVAETHQFSGDVWIVSDSSSPTITGPVTDLAYEAMQTANPTFRL
jgi:hypothetical protein